jgi:outer membrane receptor protein involved in Fe transport
VYWTGIPLEFVNRIEEVRGGGAGIWGSRAMSGVIQILTETPRTTGVRATVQGGNLETVRGDVAATYRGKRLGLALMAEQFDTEGFVQVRPDLIAPIDEPSGSSHRMGFAKAEYLLATGLSLNASVTYLDESRTGGSPLRNNGIELGTARAGARLVAGANDLALTVFGSDQTSFSTFPSEAVDRATEQPSLDQYAVPASSLGASFQWSNRSLGAHELTAGTDLFRVEGEVNEASRPVNGEFTQRRKVGGAQVLGGVYVQDQFAATSRLRLLASARFDVARHSGGFRRETNLQTNAAVIDTTYSSESESTVNVGLGARWAASDRVTWRANAYRAYRAPTLNELFKPFREQGNVLTEGNADLRSEQAVGAELGMDLSFRRTALFRLTGFWSHLQDPIVEVTVWEAGTTGRSLAPCGFVPAGGVCRQRRNLETFRSAGVEAEVELYPAAGWTASATYLWNPTEVLSAPSNPQLEGKRGSRSPQHAASVSVGWSNPRVLDATIGGRWVGKRFEDDLNSLVLDSFMVLDGRLSRQLGPHWTVFGAVENILDAEYQTVRATSGLVRVGPPRMLRGGIRVTL